MDKEWLEEERNLSPGESIIMKAVWDLGQDVPVQELIRLLREKYGKDYARTTVATFLLKLSEKGFARSYRKGRYAYVRVLKSEEEYRQRLIREETDFWFHGKISAVVLALCSSGKISREEAEEIRRCLDEMEEGK